MLSKNTFSQKSPFIYLAVCVCFLFSGFAALLYQTAWIRQFSTVFGTSELAVATVLSAYMGGLALGATLAGRFIGQVKRPVLTYGILEAAIALSALCVPLLMGVASWAYAAVLGGQSSPPDASGLGQSLFYFGVAFVVLAIPTACMGATLPLLTRYAVTTQNQIGSRVGALYAINTAGAVLGTIVAAFVLLPAMGLNGTVWFGVGVNLVVFLLAVLIAKRAPILDASADTSPQNAAPSRGFRSWTAHSLILPIMLVSGTTSFVYEVLWTRLLSHILGGSVVAFATMLASFLSGIAIGSAIASRIAVTTQRSVYAFVFVQAAVAFTSMAIYEWLHLAIPSEEGLRGNVGIAVAILLPATLFIGATFPLAVRIFSSNVDGVASSSAQVYSWNTLGAIFGAAFAGFFLIPALKYEGTIKVVVLTNIFLGLATALLLPKLRPLLVGAMGVILVGLTLAYNPTMPEEILRTSPIDVRADGEILYYEVGRSSTVLMTRNEGAIGLRTNGLPEAGSELKGAPPSRHIQYALGTLPGVIRPDAKSMLVVGFGGGNAINGVPPAVEKIDVIELEPKVIDANILASELRVLDPLADPRVRVYINDARSALSLTDKKYDSIVSQPSHPWTAGASHLYTQEYMALVADHLTEEGVFLQWMGAQFVSESLLRSLCATMLDVFEYVKVYQLFPDVLFFVGSQKPMDTEKELFSTGRPIADSPVFFYKNGFASPEDLLAGLLLDTEGTKEFSAGAKLLTDNVNRMATESASVMEQGAGLSNASLSRLAAPFVPALDPNGWVHTELNGVDFSYIANRYDDMNNRSYSAALVDTLEETGSWQSLLAAGIGLRNQGEREESDAMLYRALAFAPQGAPKNQIAYAILEPWLVAIGQGVAPEEITKIADTLTGSAAAVVNGRAAVLRQDWPAVAALDSSYIRSQPSDLWFVESTKLMVEWRNNLARLERRPEFAQQALQIVDLAIAVHPVPELYTSRVASAYFIDRPNEVLETARRLTYAVEAELDVIDDNSQLYDPELWQFRRQQLTIIRQVVNEMASRHPLDQSSVSEVVVRLDELSVRAAQRR